MINNEEVIKTIKSEYSIDVLSTKCLQDGPDNLVLKIITSDKNFVFRISKRQKSSKDIEFETSLAFFLSKSDLPVAKIISTKDGNSFCIFNEMTAILFEFCKGDVFKISPTNKPNNNLALNGGKALAKLHKELQKYYKENKNFGSRKLNSELLRVFDNKDKFVTKYLNSENFLSQIQEVLQAAASSQMNTIVHNDFRIQNVLINNDNICAILDFDWACEGNNLKDLAQALVEWSFPDGAKEYWKDIFYSFLDGYENEYGKINRENLKNWISFSCLSDASTYLMDGIEDLTEPREIRSYMYKKYLYFKGLL